MKSLNEQLSDLIQAASEPSILFKTVIFSVYHKNYNFLDCDCFKKLLFSTDSFAKLLLDSLYSYVRARLLLCFWRLIAGRRHGGLRMFMPPL